MKIFNFLKKKRTKKSEPDIFDKRFGFIKKHRLDTFENYNAVKNYYFQNQKESQK